MRTMKRQPLLPNNVHETLVQDGAMTAKAFAKFSGLSLSKVYVKMQTRELASIKVDGRYFIPRSAAIKFLADRVVAAL